MCYVHVSHEIPRGWSRKKLQAKAKGFAALLKVTVFFWVFSQGRGEERREEAPIAKYPKKYGVPKVYASLLGRFALCRLRNLPRSRSRKPRSASIARATPARAKPGT